MTEWLSKALDVLRSPKLTACVFVPAAVLIFAPPEALTHLHLKHWAEEHSAYLGVAWLVSGTSLAVSGIAALLRWCKLKRRSRRRAARLDAALASLDPHEQALLREFYLRDKNTLNLPIQEPVVNGLLATGVLEPVPGIGDGYMTTGMLAPIRISDYASSHITIELIGLPACSETAPLTDAQKEWLRNSRPDFMQRIDDIDALRHGRWP